MCQEKNMKKPFLKAVSLFVCVLFFFQTTAFAAEEVLFYHTDPVGTPLAMSNMSGQKVWEADYKPFGEEFSAGGSKGNGKRFVGGGFKYQVHHRTLRRTPHVASGSRDTSVVCC